MADPFATQEFHDMAPWFRQLQMTPFRTQAHQTHAITYGEMQTLAAMECKGPQTHNAELLAMARAPASKDAFKCLAEAVKQLGPAYKHKYEEMMAILDLGKGGGPASTNTDQPMDEDHDVPLAQASPQAAPSISTIPADLKCWTTDEDHDYKMSSHKRGIALIINNKKFKKAKERFGTDEDRDALDRLWTKLHFQTVIMNDVDAKEMLDELKKLATDPCHKSYDCVVVCILSHGNRRTVLGHDNVRVPIDDLVELFYNDKVHEYLQGKPKMFFIQACRGKTQAQLVEDDDSDEPVHQPKVHVSTADVLVCFSTAPGYVSKRNWFYGTWYIQCLVEVFDEHHKDEHVLDMMTRVNRAVGGKCTKEHSQMPSFRVQLTKKVFLR